MGNISFRCLRAGSSDVCSLQTVINCKGLYRLNMRTFSQTRLITFCSLKLWVSVCKSCESTLEPRSHCSIFKSSKLEYRAKKTKTNKTRHCFSSYRLRSITRPLQSSCDLPSFFFFFWHQVVTICNLPGTWYIMLFRTLCPSSIFGANFKMRLITEWESCSQSTFIVSTETQRAE